MYSTLFNSPLMLTIGVGLVLFFIGGIAFISKKNAFSMFIGLELMLNSINLILCVVASIYSNADIANIILIILAISAAEAAFALSLIVLLYRKKQTLNIDLFSSIKG